MPEERDVAIDQVEAAFFGLSAESGGDDDDVAVRAAIVSAGVDLLIAGYAGAVHQVEGLALGHLIVCVQEMDFADDCGALEGEGCVAADPAPAAYGLWP